MTTCEEAKSMGSGINVQGKIEGKDEVRTMDTKYGKRKVCNLYLTDDSGRIKVAIWGEDAEKVKDGDCISIEGGYTTTFSNEVQLNNPRNGKVEIISCDAKKPKPVKKWKYSDYTPEDIEKIEKQISNQGQPYFHGSTKY
tara:strand:- start:36 stop:455 length:420 start_codon:yes stop_codon:yes gene_type:complete